MKAFVNQQQFLGKVLTLALSVFALSALAPAHAQSTFGSVRGTVQDSTGATIPGTKITLHSTDENTELLGLL